MLAVCGLCSPCQRDALYEGKRRQRKWEIEMKEMREGQEARTKRTKFVCVCVRVLCFFFSDFSPRWAKRPKSKYVAPKRPKSESLFFGVRFAPTKNKKGFESGATCSLPRELRFCNGWFSHSSIFPSFTNGVLVVRIVPLCVPVCVCVCLVWEATLSFLALILISIILHVLRVGYFQNSRTEGFGLDKLWFVWLGFRSKSLLPSPPPPPSSRGREGRGGNFRSAMWVWVGGALAFHTHVLVFCQSMLASAARSI